MKIEPMACCFYCEHFYHQDPDTDACRIDDHEVYVDTPKCEQFQPYARQAPP